jgi:hypothetical protein
MWIDGMESDVDAASSAFRWGDEINDMVATTLRQPSRLNISAQGGMSDTTAFSLRTVLDSRRLLLHSLEPSNLTWEGAATISCPFPAGALMLWGRLERQDAECVEVGDFVLRMALWQILPQDLHEMRHAALRLNENARTIRDLQSELALYHCQQ